MDKLLVPENRGIDLPVIKTASWIEVVTVK